MLYGRNKAAITISMKLNDTLAEYGATTLHELLHLWMTLLRKEGFKCTNKKEHDFIYSAEQLVIKSMKENIKGNKYGASKNQRS